MERWPQAGPREALAKVLQGPKEDYLTFLDRQQKAGDQVTSDPGAQERLTEEPSYQHHQTHSQRLDFSRANKGGPN